MTSLSELKKNSSIEKLTKALAETQKFKEDERFWQPHVDKAGNGFAVIRFLDTPPQDGNDGLPWIHYYAHGFKGPTGLWYIENSLTTLGKDDPASEFNTRLWNTEIESNRKLASKQKRKLNYISNIMVVTDSNNKDNEGKVFLFRYGKKIYDKIKEKLEPNPVFEDEKSVNVFNLWEGMNFKLKIRQVEGYRNYDQSAFDAQSPIASTDEAIEKIWNQCYSLKEYYNSLVFKTYEQLKDRLDKVMGTDGSPAAAGTAEDTSITDDGVDDAMASATEGSTELSDDDELFKRLGKASKE